MPFPSLNTAWPPPEWKPAIQRWRLNEALWLNDTEALSSIFLSGGTGGANDSVGAARGPSATSALLSRLGINTGRRWAWSNYSPTTERRTDLPVPIGRSLADLSASQLMSEPPMFRYVERDERGRRTVLKGKQQDRLDLITSSDDARATLLEGAQIAAALSASILRAQWDAEDPDRQAVYFDVVGIDCSLPLWNAAGRVTEVMLWTEFPATGTKVYRHFERHIPGSIEHMLMRGTPEKVGRPVPLSELPLLAETLLGIKGVTVDEATFILTVPTGITRLTAAVWKNRPSITLRKDGFLRDLGRSDFEGIEPLLDAYSEAWGAMMRDVRLGKARQAVPSGWLETIGNQAKYDPEREFYVEMGGIDPEAPTQSMQTIQPQIRWQEHLNVLAGLKRELLDGTGWSLSSYGNSGVGGEQGGGVTATEVVDRTSKSERTRDEKGLYFKQPAQPFFRMLMELDGVIYPGQGGGVLDTEMSIDFPDVSQVDPAKQAQTFLSLRTANAISIEQTVRERRPNWDDTEVADEVEQILNDLERVKGGAETDPTALGRVDLTDPNDNPEPPDPSAPSPADEPGAPAEPPAR